MKVKALISKLQKMDPKANVYTYDERRNEYWLLQSPAEIEQAQFNDNELKEFGIEFPAIEL